MPDRLTSSTMKRATLAEQFTEVRTAMKLRVPTLPLGLR
jgi:hypothetical protein